MQNKRNEGIELLRLVLMLLVVIEHVVGHGMGVLDYVNNGDSEINCIPFRQWLIYSPCVMAVNCFVFISGYFGIRLNSYRVADLFIQAFTTSIILLLIGGILGLFFPRRMLLQSLMPVSFSYWWFLSDYVILMIFTPMLNEFTSEKMSLKMQKVLLLLGFIMLYIGGLLFNTGDANLGYSLPCFIFIYLLGRFIHQQKLFDNRGPDFSCAFFICSTILLAVLVYITQDMGPSVMKRLLAYNNPLVLLSAILFFRLFLALPIKKSFRGFSSCAFGIYLFHDNPILRPQLSLLVDELGGGNSCGINILWCSYS